MPKKVITGIAGMAAGCLLIACGYAQDYPNKPVHILAPNAGTPIDIMARLIAQGISPALGVPVIIDNRTSGALGSAVARAAPDGYTVATGGSAIWITPFLQQASYDSARDHAAITTVYTSPLVLAVNPALRATTVAELIAQAKAQPNVLTYASGPTGGFTHLAGALFTSMGGITMVRVAFKGNPEALTSVVANDIPILFADITALNAVKSGKLRALAVTSAAASPLAPGIPTIASSGLPGFEAISIISMLAPAATPAAIINRLNQEIVKVIARPEVREKALGLGVETRGDSPAQSAALIKGDMAKWGKVIKDAGITAE